MAVMLLPLFVAAVGVGILSSVFRVVERRLLHRDSSGGNNSRGLLNRVILRVNREFDFPLPREWAIPGDPDAASLLSPHDTAIEFCSKEGATFGFDIASFNLCVDPIVAALQHYLYRTAAATGNVASSTSSTRSQHDSYSTNALAVDGRQNSKEEYALNSMGAIIEVELQGPVSAVATFATPEQFPRADATLPDSVSPVSSLLDNNVAEIRHQQPNTAEIPLEVNGVTYIFEYAPSNSNSALQEASNALAATFCAAHGQQLLSSHLRASQNIDFDLLEAAQKSDYLHEGCQAPIQQALLARMV